jgi:hypothetical protein
MKATQTIARGCLWPLDPHVSVPHVIDLVGRETSEQKITASDGRDEKRADEFTVPWPMDARDGFAPFRPPRWPGTLSTFIEVILLSG